METHDKLISPNSTANVYDTIELSLLQLFPDDRNYFVSNVTKSMLLIAVSINCNGSCVGG